MNKALNITNLNKTYSNGFEALKGVNLTVKEGGFLALLGPNGAGKSTIIGIICSLINKTSGSVKVFDSDLDFNSSKAKQYIGIVPQEFNFNVFEPVIEILINQAGYYGIARDVATERAEVLLKQVGLWDKHRNPARQLSGGMKRRLMIARALMHNPRLLILDEPTAGVDIEIRRTMWDFLRELNQQGLSIILTTHYLEEAEQLCNHIAIIDNGCIIKDCNMKELLSEVNVQCLVLDIKNELYEAPVLAGYPVIKIDNKTLEVRLDKRQSMNDLFQLLSQQGIDVLSLRNKSNRLEQLFMDLVAKS
ncbi:MAG: ABC transporter ATP-binding protein [Pseudomonadota bacterium]